METETLDTFFIILYIIFCILLIAWIIYDILNLIIKKKTYITVEAEVWQHILVRNMGHDDPNTYQIQLKYSYNNRDNYYTTHWSSSFLLLPKIGKKRKIYINKNDSNKVYYVEKKHFIFFLLFRMAFLIPAIEKLLEK